MTATTVQECPRLTLHTGAYDFEADVEFFISFTPAPFEWRDATAIEVQGAPPLLPAGSELRGDGANLLVLANQWAPWGTPHAEQGVLVRTLGEITAGARTPLTPVKEGFSLAWITLSDTCAAGGREDLSGPLMEELVDEALPLTHSQGFVMPDEPLRLRGLVAELALTQRFDLILTSGGTGVGPRDTTPEAIAPLLDKSLPGFSQAMMQASLTKTPHAVISRALAGAIGRSLVITLPGSKKAVAENLAAVLPAVRHTIEKLQGDTAPCGG